MTAPAVAAPDVSAAPVAAPVAPAAPAVEPVVTPAAPPPATDGPLTKREARQALAEKILTPEPTGTPVAPEAAATPATTTPETPAAAAAPAPTGHKVIIDPGHPVRGMGIESITVQTPEEERALRALVNGTYARKKDVEESRAREETLQRRIVELEARDSANEKWTSDPRYQQAVDRFNEIKEAFGENEAALYWKGVQQDFDAIAKTEYDERWGKIEAENIERAGQAWKSEAWSHASQLPQIIVQLPHFQSWFNNAVESFNSEIELGHYPNLTSGEDAHKEFTRMFGARLIREPAVTAAYADMERRQQTQQTSAATQAAAAQAERERIARDAVEQYKQASANRRTQAPPHPLGNLGPGHDRAPVSGLNGQEPAPATANPNQLRRQLREKVGEASAARYPTR